MELELQDIVYGNPKPMYNTKTKEIFNNGVWKKTLPQNKIILFNMPTDYLQYEYFTINGFTIIHCLN